MSKLVSVIVPIYNREDLMKKCVDSILNQTYKNIEVILVDDASTDNSYKVMKEYKKQDSRIKIFTYKKNGGAGHARNVGIDNAIGDYITFVDSDDYIDDDYIETLVNNIGDADVICSGFKYLDNYYKLEKIEYLNNNSYNIFRFPTSTAKMFKTTSIRKNNIKFSNLRIQEDIRFVFEFFAIINSGIGIKYCGYNIVNNIDNKISNNKSYIRKQKIDEIFASSNLLACNNYKTKYKNEIYYFVIKDLVFNVLSIIKHIKYVDLKQYDKESYEYIKTIFDNHNIKIHFVKKFDTLKNYFIINIYILFHKVKLQNFLLRMIHLIFYRNEDSL